MAFPIGKGRNERGTFQQSTFILNYTYVQPTIMHVYKETKAITGRGQRHEQGKALRPNISNNQLTALTQFYFSGHGATNIHSKAKKKKGHPQKTRMADQVRRPLCAWSLADRMSTTRPRLVTCTLVVRRSASSLRPSPPGCADCAAELVKRRLPFVSFAPRPRTTAHNPHDLAPRGKAPPRRRPPTRRRHPKLEPPRRQKELRRNHQYIQRPRLGVLRALLLLPSNASLLPVFCSAK